MNEYEEAKAIRAEMVKAGHQWMMMDGLRVPDELEVKAQIFSLRAWAREQGCAVSGGGITVSKDGAATYEGGA